MLIAPCRQSASPQYADPAPAPARPSRTARSPLPAGRSNQSMLRERARPAGGGTVVQRKCAKCSESGTGCPGCQDEMVQRSAPGEAPAPASVPGPVQAAIGSGGGQALDPGTRRFMETRFGTSFGGVRVHTDAAAAQAAGSIGASAFTVGSSIWFGRGEYRPSRPGGLRLLAHELAHTLQQRGARPAPQTSLRVGPAGDPAELAADRAADSVLSGRPVPRVGPAPGPAIHRAPKVTRTGDDNVRLVELDDGKKYRVTRRVDWVPTTVTGPDDDIHFGAGIDSDRVWLRIDHCKETGRQEVKIGANVPAAAQKLLEPVRQSILNGTDPKAALKSAELELFVQVVISESKKYQLTVEPTVRGEPGEGRVTGGGLRGRLKTPIGDVTGEVSLNRPPQGSGRTGPDVRVVGGLEKTFGGPPAVKCGTVEREDFEPRITFTCEEIVPEHEEERTRPVTRTKRQYLYFKWSKSEFEDRPSEPGGWRNPAEMEAIKDALKGGYRVAAISGFASPEGSLEKINIPLSNDRAEAARRWIESSCPAPSPLAMRPEDASCFTGAMKPTGEGELYGEGVPEPVGEKLARQAVEEFQAAPEEEPLRTPELEKELEARRGSPQRQADLIYPLLRRARILMTKPDVETYEEKVPEKTLPPGDCPREVREAASDDFDRTPPAKPAAKK